MRSTVGTRWQAGGMLALSIVVAPAAPLVAQEAGGAGRIAYSTYTLPNGLRVVFSQDRSTPVVTVNIWYHVGSANERVRRSGFAHLFEHMMFQGTANVRPGEHYAQLQRAGATFNASTNTDRTNYFQTLPSNRLNLGLWLEADRMRSLNLSQATFETQRQAVKEERRMRVDNQPYARFIQDAIFAQLQDSTSCFAYAHTTIGDMADLDSARLPDVQAFFDQYYKPGNAVLTIVGDFAETEARTLIEQYFGGIEAGSATPPIDCRVRYNVGPRRSEVTDPNATLPMVLMVYNGPPASAADTPALDLLTTILGDGQSSRFNQRLVRQEQAALQAQSSIFGMRAAGAVINLALANQGQAPARIESLLNEEVERVRADTVSTEELTKARNLYLAEAIRSRQTTMGVAETLQSALWMNGDLETANTDWQAYQRVTVADLQRVARQYFAPENRLTLIINPSARGTN